MQRMAFGKIKNWTQTDWIVWGSGYYSAVRKDWVANHQQPAPGLESPGEWTWRLA